MKSDETPSNEATANHEAWIENYFAELQKNKEAYYQEALERFPKPGAKLRYRGTTQFWFTNIIENAERELKIGTTYTLKTIKLFSSFALITLEETGDIEFNLGFFDDLSQSISDV